MHFMLLRFRFSNFRSFRDEQELSLIASGLSDGTDNAIRSPGLDEGILPAAVIYGANASGKSNALRALQFLAIAVQSSYRAWSPDGPIPRQPFVFDDQSAHAPSRFVVDFLIEGTRHQYGAVFDSNTVLEEWLYVYPRDKKQTWFARLRGKPMSFSGKMPGENRSIEALTRKNSLFLSTAAQSNHEKLLPVYRWFSQNLFFAASNSFDLRGPVEPCRNDETRQRISELVRVADLGITELRIEQQASLRNRRALMSGEPDLKDQVQRWIESTAVSAPPHAFEQALGSESEELWVIHKGISASALFTLLDESAGTRAYLSLLGPVVQALTTGATLCVDDLDASLHPLLAAELIRMFTSVSRNPKGAQLIFNTHDTNLLSRDLLRRDQIWFAEKDDEGASHLYPLTDFKPRKEENLERGYLQGRYGAIPFLNSDAFLSALEPPTNGQAR